MCIVGCLKRGARFSSNKEIVQKINETPINMQNWLHFTKQELMLRHYNKKIDITAILYKVKGEGVQIGFPMWNEKGYDKCSGFEINLTYNLKLKGKIVIPILGKKIE